MAAHTHHRKLTRRAFLRLAGASSAAVALLGGCGRREPVPAATGSAASAGQTGRPGVLSKGGTVKWAEFYSTLTAKQEAALGIDAAANRNWMAGVIRQFEQENRGWQVELEPLPRDQADQQLAYDFNANIGHDLVFTTPQLMARHHKIGDCLDLTPFVAGLAKADQDDLGWSAAWQAARVGGLQLGVPVGLQAHGLAVNRDLCQKAGISPDRAFESLDQLLDAAARLTAADGKTWGLALFLGRSRAMVETAYAPLVWHFGGDIYDPGKKAATLSGDAHRRAAQWLSDLIYQRKVTSPAASAAEATPDGIVADALAQGQAGLAWGFGSYWIGALQRAGLLSGCLPPSAGCRAERAAITPLPTAGQAAFTTGRCLAIHRLSQQPEMAFKLLHVILRPENLRTYPDAGLPARLSTWQTAEYKSSFYQAWLAAARKGRPMPSTPYYWELADTIAAALSNIIGKRADVAATLQKAEDQWNSRYAGE